jgi:serine/threonine protein kinase
MLDETNIQSYFNSSSSSIHKARNEIKIINIDDVNLVVKSFKIPNFLNKIIYTFFKSSKAQKSYDNSIKISKFVPKPIKYLEFKKYRLLDESYFISEHFDFDFTIREPLLQLDFKDRDEIFKQFARFTYKLHNEDIFHLDYSPGNILIKENNGNYIFKIVDINRMNFKPLTIDDRLKNFNKLWAKDDDMKTITQEYAKLLNEDENYCIKKAIYYSQKNKDFVNMKKKLKT